MVTELWEMPKILDLINDIAIDSEGTNTSTNVGQFKKC
jgi:hypothetical protein